MKVTDITPGLVYAVPANRIRNGRDSYGVGAAAQVRDGQIAVPFRVDRVGKFRVKRSGACTTEIVDDYHTTTVVGSFPDLQLMLGKSRPENKYKSTGGWRRRTGHHVAASTWPGYPSGISLTGKKMKWRGEEDILTPVDIVMPWADFLKRREEWVFVANEIEAYQARHRELIGMVRNLVASTLDRAHRTSETSINIRVPSGQTLKYNDPSIMFERSYKAVLTLTDLPIELRNTVKPLLAEMADIQKRLECAL